MSQECVSIVRVVQVIEEAYRFYIFVAIVDDRSCEKCIQYDRSIMTRREIEGLFSEYLEKVSDELWLPHVHPNCRCELHLFEESEE